MLTFVKRRPRRLVTRRSSGLGVKRGKMIRKVHGMRALVFRLGQFPIHEMRAQRLFSPSKVLDGALQPRHGRGRIAGRAELGRGSGLWNVQRSADCSCEVVRDFGVPLEQPGCVPFEDWTKARVLCPGV